MLNVAIQAGRLGAWAAPKAPAAIKVAKTLAVVVAADVALNEVLRGGANAFERKIKDAEAANDPFVKTSRSEGKVKRTRTQRLFDIREGEKWHDSVARRGRMMWDIAMFGLGDALHILNFCTVKLVKGALYLAGALVASVIYLIVLIPMLIARTIKLSPERFDKIMKATWTTVSGACFLPFLAVRWLDRKIEAGADKLAANRSVLTVMKRIFEEHGDFIKAKWTEAGEAAHAEAQAEEGVKVTEVKIDEVVMTEVNPDGKQTRYPGDLADVVPIFITLTLDPIEARRDPKAYGRQLFSEELAQSSLRAAATHRRTTLPNQLRRAGLQDGDVALVLQGYDEAVIDAASGSTAATV